MGKSINQKWIITRAKTWKFLPLPVFPMSLSANACEAARARRRMKWNQFWLSVANVVQSSLWVIKNPSFPPFINVLGERAAKVSTGGQAEAMDSPVLFSSARNCQSLAFDHCQTLRDLTQCDKACFHACVEVETIIDERMSKARVEEALNFPFRLI